MYQTTFKISSKQRATSSLFTMGNSNIKDRNFDACLSNLIQHVLGYAPDFICVCTISRSTSETRNWSLTVETFTKAAYYRFVLDVVTLEGFRKFTRIRKQIRLHVVLPCTQWCDYAIFLYNAEAWCCATFTTHSNNIMLQVVIRQGCYHHGGRQGVASYPRW